MPYVTCGRCGVKTFSVAYWSSVDYCDTCGTRFPRAARKVVSVARLGRLVAPPSAREEGRLPRADDQRGRDTAEALPPQEAAGSPDTTTLQG